MQVRFVYNTVDIRDDLIEPIYFPNNGLVIDKNSKELLYKLPEKEMTRFFYFRIEFDSYKYANYYQPKTDVYKEEMTSRVYNLVLYLNLTTIMRDKGFTKSLYHKLSHYLASIQMKDIQCKKDYHTDEDNINYFINYRNTNAMYIIPWYCVKLNNNIVFDLKQKKIMLTNTKNINKICFKRKGGIIETNNVRKLIKTYFRVTKLQLPNLNDLFNQQQMDDLDSKALVTCSIKQSIPTRPGKTLIILPSNMVDLWPGYNILTYDKLLVLKNSDIEYLRSGNFGQVIVHECYVQVLPHIKSLVALLDCEQVWIINSLPLRYYFATDKTPSKLNVNDLASITNLWLNFGTGEKRRYKTELIRLLLTKFNQFYTIINYKTELDFFHIRLGATPFEKYIYTELNKSYHNWKSKLTNDKENKYSFTTKEKNNAIESKIFNTVVSLMTSVVKSNQIGQYFEPIIKKSLVKINKMNTKIKELVDVYQQVSTSKTYKIHSCDIDEFNYIFNELKENDTMTKSMIANYNRYLTGTIYQDLEDNACPICYSSDELVKTKLICGHCICIECILSSLKSSTKCPVCNEHINTQKIAIMQESLVCQNSDVDKSKLIPQAYSSNLLNLLKNFDRMTVILTNLSAFDNLVDDDYKMNVINVSNKNVSDKIKKIYNVDQIILLVAPKCMYNKSTEKEFYHIINYFKLFNKKPKISKIEINFEQL